MLKTRVITALVLLAVFLPVTLFAPISGFGALIAFVLIFAAWEWARLLKLSRNGTLTYAAIAGLALVLSMHLLSTSETSFYKASAVFWVIGAPYILLRKPTLIEGAWRGMLLVVGVILLIACWYAVVSARILGVPFVLTLLLWSGLPISALILPARHWVDINWRRRSVPVKRGKGLSADGCW